MMKYILGLVVIIGTLVIAGRQPANKMGSVLGVLFVGFMVFALVAQLPSCESESNKNSYSYSGGNSAYSGSGYSSGSYTRKKALTKEEAEALRGTGYNGTKPYSSAEAHELRAAQVTCKECGYHSDNGYNSLCDYCQNKKGK